MVNDKISANLRLRTQISIPDQPKLYTQRLSREARFSSNSSFHAVKQDSDFWSEALADRILVGKTHDPTQKIA